MVKVIVFLVTAILSLPINSSGENQVIYGRDDRREVYNSGSLYRRLAKSVAARIDRHLLKEQEGRDHFLIDSGVLSDSENFCHQIRFGGQVNAASATGWLIAPDLIVTAGHAMGQEGDCETYKWVFGYQLERGQNPSRVEIPKNDVYSCKEIVEISLGFSYPFLDYALIRLDRPVLDRLALKFSKRSSIPVGTPLVIIGSSLGVPLKVSGGAKVRFSNYSTSFTANIDSFAGNSGSPVFNTITRKVVGILITGEMDFVYDKEKQCTLIKRCPDEGCIGEVVSYISNIPWAMKAN